MRCSFWLWLCGSAAALSPLNVLVISFGQHPCPPAHPAYRQTDRETDTHTQTHCKTHFMGHRVQSSESEGQAKPRQQKTDREREQKKPGQKLIMARTARKRLRGQSVRERENAEVGRWECRPSNYHQNPISWPLHGPPRSQTRIRTRI